MPIVDHAAIFVNDIKWYMDFFARVLNMPVKEIDGDPAAPNQAWLEGGIQLIAKPGFSEPEGRMAHIGITVEDAEAVLERAYRSGVTELPQGRNWIRLPDGLCLEIL